MNGGILNDEKFEELLKKIVEFVQPQNDLCFALQGRQCGKDVIDGIAELSTSFGLFFSFFNVYLDCS